MDGEMISFIAHTTKYFTLFCSAQVRPPIWMWTQLWKGWEHWGLCWLPSFWFGGVESSWGETPVGRTLVHLLFYSLSLSHLCWPQAKLGPVPAAPHLERWGNGRAWLPRPQESFLVMKYFVINGAESVHFSVESGISGSIKGLKSVAGK